MPRPRKLTPDLAGWIVERIRAGWPRSDVIRSAGIGRRSLDRWLAEGRGGHPDYNAFAAAFDLANRSVMGERERDRREAAWYRLQGWLRERGYWRKFW
jgi:hypothetical protein